MNPPRTSNSDARQSENRLAGLHFTRDKLVAALAVLDETIAVERHYRGALTQRRQAPQSAA